jgi:hypothetical protein
VKGLELPISVITAIMIANSGRETTNTWGRVRRIEKGGETLLSKYNLYEQLVIKF